MKKSKIILLYKLFIIISILYSFLIVKTNHYVTHYQEGNVEINGTIRKINIDGNKISIVVKAKEDVLVNYYIDSIEEKNKYLQYQLGDQIHIRGEMTLPSENTVFNMFNYRNYLKSQKIYFVLRAEEVKKIKNNKNIFFNFKNSVNKRIEKDFNKAYLKTFILGDKALLSEEEKLNYQENGVSHLLAISGMHITLFANILDRILSKIKKGNHHILICLF